MRRRLSTVADVAVTVAVSRAVVVRALAENGADLVMVSKGRLGAEHGIGAFLCFADAGA